MDDRDLDALFSDMSAIDARPHAALTGAIMADAARLSEGRRGIWAALAQGWHGWQVGAGLAVCAICGVWIGTADLATAPIENLFGSSVTIDLLDSGYDALAFGSGTLEG